MSNEGKWIASDGVTELKPGMLVLVRDHVNFNWRVNVFSHCLPENGCYLCTYDSWVMCIPLEGNEHMTGTALPIKQREKPFEWGEKVLVWCDGEDEKTPAIFICDLGDDEKYRYKVILKGTDTLTLWQYCERAPLDADAEPR